MCEWVWHIMCSRHMFFFSLEGTNLRVQSSQRYKVISFLRLLIMLALFRHRHVLMHSRWCSHVSVCFKSCLQALVINKNIQWEIRPLKSKFFSFWFRTLISHYLAYLMSIGTSFTKIDKKATYGKIKIKKSLVVFDKAAPVEDGRPAFVRCFMFSVSVDLGVISMLKLSFYKFKL